MLIIGARGFAKEVLEILHQNFDISDLYFYDDVNIQTPSKIFGEFKVLKNENEVATVFNNMEFKYTIGLGNPALRFKIYERFQNLGGRLSSVVSKFSEIGSYNVNIGIGCNILGGVRISNDVTIGMGTLIYYNSVITHDVIIGKFCEIAPSVNLLGRAQIGNFVKIGSGAIIFPDVKIGCNSIIAAGAVVRNDIPENVMVAGIPAVIKKMLIN